MDQFKTAVVTQYVAAWNQTELAARDALLERCWADGGVYVDPNVELAGREALRGTSQGAGGAEGRAARIPERHRGPSQRGTVPVTAGAGRRDNRRNVDRFRRNRPRPKAGPDHRIFWAGAAETELKRLQLERFQAWLTRSRRGRAIPPSTLLPKGN